MKRLIIALLALTVVCGTIWAGYAVKGFGKVLTATTTPTKLNIGQSANDYSMLCNVVVYGADRVFFMINTETNAFVATNAMPVSAGFPQELWNGTEIKSICYATTNGTSEFEVRCR